MSSIHPISITLQNSITGFSSSRRGINYMTRTRTSFTLSVIHTITHTHIQCAHIFSIEVCDNSLEKNFYFEFQFCHSIFHYLFDLWHLKRTSSQAHQITSDSHIKHSADAHFFLSFIFFQFKLIAFCFCSHIFLFLAGAVAFLYCCTCEKRLIEYAVS